MTAPPAAAAERRPVLVAAGLVPTATDGARAVGLSLVPVPGGAFRMGTDDADGFPADGEGPVRTVDVGPLRVSTAPVTNEVFARFVEDTGYRTDAERAGWSFVFHLLVAAAARAHVVDGVVPAAPWWQGVRGATWRSPEGPGSDVRERPDHPVVHVSYRDAQEFCAWSGTRLPREPEWERAARGGLDQTRYPWGDELTPGGEHRCNIWQGEFPTTNTRDDGYLGTSPVGAFPPNGYGLLDVAGNVWELCDEPWSTPSGAGGPDEVVVRGGSYLCHASYCNRYRVAARTRTTLGSTSGNTGFRVVADA